MKQVAQQEAERARFIVEKVREKTNSILGFMREGTGNKTADTVIFLSVRWPHLEYCVRF